MAFYLSPNAPPFYTLLFCRNVHFGLLNEQVSNNKNRKNHTSNAICSHKGDIDLAQIGGLYNAMLVNQHGNKHPYPHPIQ